MLFNSHLFLFVFLPLLLAGWFLLNRCKKYRLAQGYLVGMSLWFYAHLNPAYLWALLGSCLAGYLFCLPFRKKDTGKWGKVVLALGCLFHLGMLGYFKYRNFFVENVNGLLGSEYPLLSLFLPVGISFYTFQQLGYLIDCAKGEAPVCSFGDYLTFMVYFPQLLQGPILRYGEIVPAFHEEQNRRWDTAKFAVGMQHFTIGLAKKVLLADTLAKAVNFGYDHIPLLDCPSAVLLAVGYLFELYFDFSGYCDMAVGLGKMIGMEIVENFDSPFWSASVKEFWRRWHITLGRFFTKYVYIPLGGSRKGKLRTVGNTLVVFLLSGLWHGASWTFVFWGFLHGIGVAWDSLGILNLPKKWMRQALTFTYVCLAFIFFRAETIGEGFLVLRAMFTPKWNGFLFQMGEALELSEPYIFTKGISMAAPALLPVVYLLLLLFVFAVSITVLAQRRAAVLVENAALERGYALGMAFLFVWSVLSMTGVGEYLYFSF